MWCGRLRSVVVVRFVIFIFWFSIVVVFIIIVGFWVVFFKVGC